MQFQNILIIFYITVLSFCALYAPQPLLPLLSQHFQISTDQVSLLISVALIPLGVAPILYGFILESMAATRLLKITIFLLALGQLPFILIDNFWVLVGFRTLEGLLFPAIFTALVTYISTVSTLETIKRNIALYVAATVLGGFLGRMLSGVMATYFHWTDAFLIIMLGLLLGFGLLYRLQSDTRLQLVRPTWGLLYKALQHPIYNKVYLIIFLVFFCFASVLNFLPFRMTELDSQVSSLRIALTYTGYLVGIMMALNALRIIRWCSGEMNAILLGLAFYMLSLILLAIPSLIVISLTLFLFCAGMFLMHSVLSGYLNHLAVENKGIINGLYIASYYAGGSTGSYLPVFIYKNWGWIAYLSCLLGLVFIIMYITLLLKRVQHNLA
ncbi:arabinose efflux permease family protein [Beggiatoa alba B18LD]|uniref:Arabinose efflux permease family protein n=1 Tax=Beggiatoa alba B18LD TaxID=395493 RepID=I3CIB6_9GAMM|nr:MFS transporter [Beggiatoa alba]EIJ43359.1 arabinose efflux permease family protein [Beggiatoa alba B18LD]